MRPVGQEIELEGVEPPLEEALGDFPHRLPIEILVQGERAEIEQVGELQGELFGGASGPKALLVGSDDWWKLLQAARFSGQP